MVYTVAGQVIKSVEDDQVYSGFVLDSGMKVMVVSDPCSNKAAASLSVNVGYYSDPDEMPGLAHFLEHMLFLGTEKHPSEDHFSMFLKKNGGSHNAGTREEDTTYTFEVNSEALPESLDIWSQFFISPLFTESATDREIKAIESEHAKNLVNDLWRKCQLLRQLCLNAHETTNSIPRHPFCKFGTGTDATIRGSSLDFRSQLLQFFQKYYNASIMTLCVVGPQSVDNLTHLVVAMFRHVPNRHNDKIIRSEAFGCPWPAVAQPMVIDVVATKDRKDLEFWWPCDSDSSFKDSKMHYFITHLLGHEAEGSILSKLKLKGWASALSAGLGLGTRHSDWVCVIIQLTDEGSNYRSEICRIMFGYLSLLRRGIPLYLFEEQSRIADLGFQFASKRSPYDQAEIIARRLLLWPLEHVNDGPCLYFGWNNDDYVRLLKCLTIDNVNIMYISNAISVGDTFETEKWYGTRYSYRYLSATELSVWRDGCDEGLAFPSSNPFIPMDFSPRGIPWAKNSNDDNQSDAVMTYPKLIYESSAYDLWHKYDYQLWCKPKTNVFVAIENSYGTQSASAFVAMKLFAEAFEESFINTSYYASCAGSSSFISASSKGLSFTFSGYSDRLGHLILTIFQSLKSFVITDECFNVIKDRYRFGLRRMLTGSPYITTVQISTYLLQTPSPYLFELLPALETMTIELLRDSVTKISEFAHLSFLCIGNISEADALALASACEERWGYKALSKQLRPQYRCVMLQSPTASVASASTQYILRCLAFNELEANSGYQTLIQIGWDDVKSRVTLDLFCQIFAPIFFQKLRTEQQIGYVVSLDSTLIHRVNFLRVVIQSASHSPVVIHRQVLEFFNGCHGHDSKRENNNKISGIEGWRGVLNHLYNMSNDEFENQLLGLISDTKSKFRSLNEESNFYWNELSTKARLFNRKTIETNLLRHLSKTDVIQLIECYILPSVWRILSIIILPSGMGSGFDNVVDWRPIGTSDDNLTDSDQKAKENKDELIDWNWGDNLISITDVDTFKRQCPLFPSPS